VNIVGPNMEVRRRTFRHRLYIYCNNVQYKYIYNIYH